MSTTNITAVAYGRLDVSNRFRTSGQVPAHEMEALS